METYICHQCGFFTGDFQRFKCHQVTTHEMDSNELIKYTCAYCGIRVCGRDTLERHLASDICGKYFMCEYCSCCYESIFALRQHTATHRGKRSRPRNSPTMEPPKKLARKTASLSVIIREQARINATSEQDALKQSSAGMFFAKITPLDVQDVNPDIPQSSRKPKHYIFKYQDVKKLIKFDFEEQEIVTAAKLDEKKISRLMPSPSKRNNLYLNCYKIIGSPKKNATVHFLRESTLNKDSATKKRPPVPNIIQEIIEKPRPKMAKNINTRDIGTQNFPDPLERAADFVLYNVQPMEMDTKPMLESFEPMAQNTAPEYPNEDIMSRVIKLESRDDLDEMEVDLSRVKQEPIEDEIKNEPVPMIQGFTVKEEPAESSSSSDTETDAWNPTTMDTPSMTEWNKEVSPALYLCEYCELSTGQREKLIRHYAYKHPWENRSNKAFLPTCPLCFKHFKTVECVRTHRSVIHDENDGIGCEEDCHLHWEQFETFQMKDAEERPNTPTHDATDSNNESACNSQSAEISTNEDPDTMKPLIKTGELPIFIKTEPLSDEELDFNLPKDTSEMLIGANSIKTERT